MLLYLLVTLADGVQHPLSAMSRGEALPSRESVEIYDLDLDPKP